MLQVSIDQQLGQAVYERPGRRGRGLSILAKFAEGLGEALMQD
jgi:hypothetical protein